MSEANIATSEGKANIKTRRQMFICGRVGKRFLSLHSEVVDIVSTLTHLYVDRNQDFEESPPHLLISPSSNKHNVEQLGNMLYRFARLSSNHIKFGIILPRSCSKIVAAMWRLPQETFPILEEGHVHQIFANDLESLTIRPERAVARIRSVPIREVEVKIIENSKECHIIIFTLSDDDLIGGIGLSIFGWTSGIGRIIHGMKF